LAKNKFLEIAFKNEVEWSGKHSTPAENRGKRVFVAQWNELVFRLDYI